MFDHVDPRLFWPALVLFCFVVSLFIGWLIGSMIRYCSDDQNRYVDTDPSDDLKRKNTARGFKSKAGIR